MATRIRIHRPTTTKQQPEIDTQADETFAAAQSRPCPPSDDTDDLLDEIDAVLEENAT
jgi:hypothetical protein